MFIEFGIIFCFLFFICVWFYKQRRTELELLQVEFAQAGNSLRDLAQEKQPIVIRGVPVPPVLTAAQLEAIPRVAEFPLYPGGAAAGATVGAYRRLPAAVHPDWQSTGRPILTEEAGTLLAEELALPLWTDRTLRDALLDLGALPLLTFYTVRAVFGPQGLQRALGSFVCFLPTQGTYTVSLVSASSEPFLPKAPENRYPSSFSMNDTPMVGEIKYIDVVVRPGTMLCIPAQTLFSLEQTEKGPFHAALLFEIHTPVSWLAKMLEGPE
jgi:hypothetical protein